VDGVSFAQIEVQGLEAWLAGLREELVSKTYRPDPVRRVMIPKPDGGGERAHSEMADYLTAPPVMPLMKRSKKRL
jgi:retron-type reverse transcriptase